MKQTDIQKINSKLSSEEEQIVDSIISEINSDPSNKQAPPPRKPQGPQN